MAFCRCLRHREGVQGVRLRGIFASGALGALFSFVEVVFLRAFCLVAVALLVLLAFPGKTYAPGAPREETPSSSPARPVCLASRGEIRFSVRWMTVTAYTSGPESTGRRPGHPLYGVTASGERVRPGTVAADPSIPFGTRVYIPGYGLGVVLDRGGAIRGDRLDVYFERLEDALNWGVRRLPVRFYY